MIYSHLENGERREKRVRVSFDLSADVLVVGVGTAGTYAALAAAEGGAQTVALERGSGIGGMFTVGGVTGFYYGERGGSYEETLTRTEQLSSAFLGGSKGWASLTVMTEQLLEAGVKLNTGATVLGIYIKKSTVVGVKALIRGKVVNIEAKVIIDASSDGHIVRMCPVKTSFGRPTDGRSAPFTCWTTVMKDGVLFEKNVDDGYTNQYEPWSFSDAVVSAHASKLCFEAEGEHVVRIAALPGVREGISFDGEQTLSYTDILRSRDPERVLFNARSDLDKHGTDIALDEDGYQNFWCISNLATVVAVIPVPLGAIMPRGVRGIVTAGRCLSVDSYALGAVRMNRDMMRMGECVGTLAALAVRSGCDVREVDYSEYVRLTDLRGCRLGTSPDRFAFDHPHSLAGVYRTISFDMSDDEIIAALGTRSPGVAIYSCYLSDGHIKPRLIPLLNSPDEGTALGAALALGIMGDGSGIDVLRRAVEHRSLEIFEGCRRSNQFVSAVAICMLARFGQSQDIELLSPIVFDEAERSKDMYAPEKTPQLAHARCDVRFAYFQHFTHALVAMAKIAARCGRKGELLERLNTVFDRDGTDELLDFVTMGAKESPFGESLLSAIEYAKGILQ